MKMIKLWTISFVETDHATGEQSVERVLNVWFVSLESNAWLCSTREWLCLLNSSTHLLKILSTKNITEKFSVEKEQET